MNHGIGLRRLQQSGMRPSTYLGSQHQLDRQLPNMYGRNSSAVNDLDGIFSKVLGLLLGDYVRAVPCHWHDLQERLPLLL